MGERRRGRRTVNVIRSTVTMNLNGRAAAAAAEPKWSTIIRNMESFKFSSGGGRWEEQMLCYVSTGEWGRWNLDFIKATSLWGKYLTFCWSDSEWLTDWWMRWSWQEENNGQVIILITNWQMVRHGRDNGTLSSGAFSVTWQCQFIGATSTGQQRVQNKDIIVIFTVWGGWK